MGLKNGDLRDLVNPVFEIDNFKSKMGDDEDICVISFSVKEGNAAKDLVEFIEKSYDFVLDADKTSGEQSDGMYKVFVELERNKDVPSQIMEIADGISKLADLNDMRFRYYKNFKSLPIDEQSLTSSIPSDSSAYEIKINETQLENYKNFFQNSYVDEVIMNENRITFYKKYSQPLSFEFKDFGSTEEMRKDISESFDINKMPEVMFLSKFVGDFNIQIYGDKYLFETNNKSVVLYNKQYEPK